MNYKLGNIRLFTLIIYYICIRIGASNPYLYTKPEDILTTITSIANLISSLQNSGREAYKSIGANIDIPISEFEKYTYWSSHHYTRNLVYRCDHFELILLCWDIDQKTPVHCHSGEECWVYCIEGSITETNFQLVDDIPLPTNQEVLTSGHKTFMNDDLGYHSLENTGGTKAMTLHLYMDPIDHCTYYCTKSRKFLPIKLSYCTIDGVEANNLII